MTKEKKSNPKKTKNQAVKKPVINLSEIYDQNKSYPIGEAMDILKKIAREKFDSSVEVHFRLGINPKKGDQQIRGTVNLPHGSGKTVRVAAFVQEANEAAVKKAGADLVGGEDLIAEIKKTGKSNFEVAVAEPAMMKILAPIAKILGTRGLMPSPKNETVTPDPAKIVAELKKGKISFKNDESGNLHTVIGKISFDDQKLLDNWQEILGAIKKSRPAGVKGTYLKNIYICSSMSPAIKVNVD